MRDFDKERAIREAAERTLRIGGEDFTYKASVAPEVIIRWNQAISGELPDLTEEGWLALYDETILLILEPGQQDRWQEVRDPARKNPLTIGDMKAVLTFLIAEATRLPTGEPSGSSTGSSTTAPAAKVESSSPADASETSTPERSAP